MKKQIFQKTISNSFNSVRGLLGSSKWNILKGCEDDQNCAVPGIWPVILYTALDMIINDSWFGNNSN